MSTSTMRRTSSRPAIYPFKVWDRYRSDLLGVVSLRKHASRPEVESALLLLSPRCTLREGSTG